MSFIWGLIIVLLIALQVILFLTAPGLFGRKPRKKELLNKNYAHRGLHNDNVPENSLTAFDKAAEKGYGIELDVRLTKDEVPVIFHDETLERMCGVNKNVSDCTYHELAALRLANTDEGIPTLEAALSKVNERVPLIIELKGDKIFSFEIARVARQVLQNYRGVYCIESFNPFLLFWYRFHDHRVMRGQLATDPGLFRKATYKNHPEMLLCGYLLCNLISRPDFIAYDHKTDKNLFFRLCRCVFRPLLVAWNVTKIEEFERLQDYYDLQIFENFEP